MTTLKNNWKDEIHNKSQELDNEMPASEALKITLEALEIQNIISRILKLVRQEAELGNKKARYMDSGFDGAVLTKEHLKVISKLEMLGYTCSDGDYCLEVIW
jgi:Holliday junction resolvasome RuvABC ATP-dependent DNA helicase subunit